MRLTIASLMLLLAVGLAAQEKLILLNEGMWQADNGRVTYFEDGQVVSNQWFRDVNGKKLGDTPNDIIQINDNLIAIAVNWSNIVQFITPEGKAVAATEDIPNNRKLCSDGKFVYVTSYGHECLTTSGYKYFDKGYVAKIDLSTFKTVAACEVGYEPEGIALYKGRLFVANSGGYAAQENHDYETTVSILDAATMTVEKTVDTHVPNLFGKMSQCGRYLCINSSGDYYEMSAASLIFDCEKALNGEADCYVRFDYPATYNCTTCDGRFFAIGSSFSYLTGDYEFSHLTIDPKAMIETSGQSGLTQTLPGTLKDDFAKMGQPYGIYVNPYTGYIYGTDATSFEGAGYLYQWSPEGQLLGKHKVYVNPGHFLALPPDGHFSGNDNPKDDDQPDNGQHTAFIQAVDEYVPAPGQFVNTLPEATADDTPQTMAEKCTKRLAGDAREMVTLGAYGGYITFHFDHPVANVEGQRDFAVWGNAFDNNAEPAIVLVAQDTNGNRLPDDEWYELRGSEYDNPLTLHNYELTYTYNAMGDIPWSDNHGMTGSVLRNTFHIQEYFPLWLAAQGTLTFRGARLPDNAVLNGNNYLLPAYDYGYADNQPNSDAEGCSLDIGWAVDVEGRPVSLTHIDFVRCYNAMNQTCGRLGETSTEILGAEDLHLDASIQFCQGISDVITYSRQEEHSYDLLGRKAPAVPRTGLYVKNGKKYFFNNNHK
ncbi:MAG: hypothetical protein J6Z14_03190 [Prevotella sp.]|nr:hypothetical protein [Prevotella sp.]